MVETPTPAPGVEIPCQGRRLHSVAPRGMEARWTRIKGGARVGGRHIVRGPKGEFVIETAVTYVMRGISTVPEPDALTARTAAAGNAAGEAERIGSYANQVRVTTAASLTGAMPEMATDSGLEGRKNTAGVAT